MTDQPKTLPEPAPPSSLESAPPAAGQPQRPVNAAEADFADVRDLVASIAAAVDAKIEATPTLAVLSVCSALGAVAGHAVAMSRPAASPMLEDAYAGLLMQAFRTSLAETRPAAGVLVN